MRNTARTSGEGARAAAEMHARLGTGRQAPVDIFDALTRAGIWLMFQPLDNLYGAYIRAADAPGVILNAKQPPSLQRFTAAHELGHHALGHASSLDDEANIQPRNGDLGPLEQAAHAFAAYFLMPPPLVEQALARLGLAAGSAELEAEHAYRLSLEFGVSYAAAVNHLLSLSLVTTAAAAQLRARRPKAIKESLTAATRPPNDRVDVWLLGERDAGRVIHPRVYDELYVSLPEIPSSGYRWSVNTDEVADLRAEVGVGQGQSDVPLALIEDRFTLAHASGERIRPGSGGTRHLVFRVRHPGRLRLQLARRRGWETTAASTWYIDLQASRHRTLRADWGLLPQQKPFLARAGL